MQVHTVCRNMALAFQPGRRCLILQEGRPNAFGDSRFKTLGLDHNLESMSTANSHAVKPYEPGDICGVKYGMNKITNIHLASSSSRDCATRDYSSANVEM